jgi:hypothetical protein
VRVNALIAVYALALSLVSCTGTTAPGHRAASPTGASSTAAERSLGPAIKPLIVKPHRHHLPGPTWRVPAGMTGGIEGYANPTSVLPGQRVRLYVSTPAQQFVVRAFRMGWYGARLGHETWASRPVPAILQPEPILEFPATRTYTARWQRSITISTRGWRPGVYLLRLDASSGHESYIPLTVRARSSAGRVVLITPITTWQAYNVWGCCDLYRGGDGSFASRSRAVTFDRPYVNEDGAGQFAVDELGVVAEAQRVHLRLDYVTDVDLAVHPGILAGARAVVSMGHDEYWSPAMRAAVTAARDAGTNLAFLGANAIFRRIRLGSTWGGANRLEINYKVAAEDPLYGKDNSAVTADWPQPPDARPESSLLGAQYGCYFGDGTRNVDGIVTDPGSWLFAGTGTTLGEKLPRLVGPEVDAVQPAFPTPSGISIVMQSPVPCPGGIPPEADASYYVASSGAGVFDAGTIGWACEVGPTCGGRRDEPTHSVVRQVTDNLLERFARGPAGSRARSHG